MSDQPPVTCSIAGPGQGAFIDGLVHALGFRATIEIAPELRAGRPVLLHGWRDHYPGILRSHPGKLWSVWHSGWAGSDVMGEGVSLANALRAARARTWGLLWLDERDLPPPGGLHLAPVWSPAALAALAPKGVERQPRSVVVGLHGAFASAAKNILAGVAVARHVGAHVHISQPVLDQAVRGATLRELLEAGHFTAHPVLERADAVRVLAGVEVLVHASVSETWPYQPMEAIYCGTPVLLSEVVPLADALPPAVRERCVIGSPKETMRLSCLLRDLLDSPQLRDDVAGEQRRVLDRLAPEHTERAAKTLAAVRTIQRSMPCSR